MIDYQQDTTKQSSPTWGCGLKQALVVLIDGSIRSSPTWGRGLKPNMSILISYSPSSSPTWGRGLKHLDGIADELLLLSSPTWGRGLKHRAADDAPLNHVVVPYMGTWIETCRRHQAPTSRASRPLHGDVD